MLIFHILSTKNNFFIKSCFDSNKFAFKKKKSLSLYSTYEIDLIRLVAYFRGTFNEEEEHEEVKLRCEPIYDSTHPFNLKVGPAYFGRYSHVIEVATKHFNIWLYGKSIPLSKIPKGKQVTCISSVKRNDYIKINGEILRIIKIETTNANKKGLICVDEEDEEQKEEKRYFDKIKISQFRSSKQKEDKPDMIVYDCETIAIEGKLMPFIISAKHISLNEDFLWFKESSEFDMEECQAGITKFVTKLHEWVMKEAKFYGALDDEFPNQYKVYLFGYNNFNFDNHFIYEKMRSCFNGFHFEHNSRFGKTTSGLFRKKGVQFKMVDLIRWFPATPLIKACKDYSIEASKYDVDIVKYCNDCASIKRLITRCDDMQNYFKSKIDLGFFDQYKLIDGSFDIYKMIIDYCVRDVEATAELYQKLNDNMLQVIGIFNGMGIKVPSTDLFHYISPPQLAFYILKEMMAKKKIPIMKMLNDQHAQFMYDSYMGGRCDYTILGEVMAWKDEKGEDGEYIYADVTSEYPTAMKGYFPNVADINSIFIGEDINYSYLQNMLDQALAKRNELFRMKTLHLSFDYLSEINKIKGVFMCNIYPCANEQELSTWSPVGTRIYEQSSSKLYFLNCAQTNKILNTAHWMALILGGWRIEIVVHEFNILFTDQDTILKEYIDVIGEKKAQAGSNKSLRNIYKLMMNSLYGKLAQKPKHLIHTQMGRTNNEEYNVYLNEKTMMNDWSSSYHYISTYITGYSNWMIWQTCYFAELEHIYEGRDLSWRTNINVYTDTDSLIINKNKASKFLNFEISENLGEWDDDKQNFRITWKLEEFGEPIRKLIVLSRKTYFLIGDNNKVLSIKAKGVHTEQAKKITYDDLKKIAWGDSLKLNFDGLTKKSHNLEGTLSFNQDFVKDIFASVIKKSLNRDTIYEFNIINTTEPQDIKNNELCLNFAPYKENICHFLQFTCSSRILAYWELNKQIRERHLDEVLDSIIDG